MSTAEIEAALVGHAAVAQAAVIAELLLPALLQAAAAYERLDAAAPAAVAARARVFVRFGPRQRVVAPLAGDRVGPGDHGLPDDELAGYRWNRVVLDEAQRIKNWNTKTAQAVKRLRMSWTAVAGSFRPSTKAWQHLS